MISLQGCSFTTYDHGEKISTNIRAELPNYSVNDVFIFNNGYIERVSAIDGDIIDWEAAGGAFNYKAYRNFALPRISWKTKKKKSRIEMVVLDKNVMWPLTTDEDYKMSFKKHISKNDIAFSNRFFFQDWSCETNDARRITVPAGAFNTIPVTCQLISFSGNVIKTRTWYYSPAVGHYVKRVDKSASSVRRIGKTKVFELTSYIPAFSGLSSKESKAAEMHLQLSLEKLPSGSKAVWVSNDGKISRTISLLETFQTQGDNFCRNVAFKIKSPSRPKSYTTVFCRDEDAWKIALING
jgi:surface antigen